MADRAPTSGSAAWALRRFELACERADHGEALTDVLLGLRALLEADGHGSGVLPDRLAALCAAPGEFDRLRDRTEIAEALEVALMQGITTDPSRTRALSLELRGHLRALLRDMACGHLPTDLVAVAEQHLLHDDLDADVVEHVDQGVHGDVAFDDFPVVVTDTRTGDFPVVVTDTRTDFSGVITDARAGDPPVVVTDQRLDEGGPEHEQVARLQPSHGPVTVVRTSAPSAGPAPVSVEVAAAPRRPAVVPPAHAIGQVHGAEAYASPRLAPVQPAPEFEPAQPAPAQPTVDPRSVTESGEDFEAAFIRSLTEGPSSLR